MYLGKWWITALQDQYKKVAKYSCKCKRFDFDYFFDYYSYSDIDEAYDFDKYESEYESKNKSSDESNNESEDWKKDEKK